MIQSIQSNVIHVIISKIMLIQCVWCFALSFEHIIRKVVTTPAKVHVAPRITDKAVMNPKGVLPWFVGGPMALLAFLSDSPER